MVLDPSRMPTALSGIAPQAQGAVPNPNTPMIARPAKPAMPTGQHPMQPLQPSPVSTPAPPAAAAPAPRPMPPQYAPSAPAARDRALNALGTPPAPAITDGGFPVPTGVPGVPGAVPPIGGPLPPTPAPGGGPIPIDGPGTGAPGGGTVTPPATTPPADLQSWLASRPSGQDFAASVRAAATPEARRALVDQFRNDMHTWHSNFRDWRHDNRGGAGGSGAGDKGNGGAADPSDYSAEWDHLNATDPSAGAAPVAAPAPADAAAAADALRIKKMRTSRTGG